jgi:hypothetical protein
MTIPLVYVLADTKKAIKASPPYKAANKPRRSQPSHLRNAAHTRWIFFTITPFQDFLQAFFAPFQDFSSYV